MDEVEAATRYQLGTWFRFLPSAGSRWAGQPDFKEMYLQEKTIMNRIIERFDEAGGMDSGLSKAIGWVER